MASTRKSISLSRYQDVSSGYPFLAATDYSVTPHVIAAGKAGWTVFVIRIVLSVTTDNAATQTIQDSAGTPVPIATSKVSPGLGPIVWDFGENGTPITEGKDLTHKMSAAGMAGDLYVEAYMRQTGTLVANIAGTRAGL